MLDVRVSCAQEADPVTVGAGNEQADDDPTPAAPEIVNVDEVVEDTSIEDRLLRILNATEWFEEVQIRVEEGVVFLEGTTERQQNKDWAGRLASNTQDVVAVVNRVRVADPPIWNLQPAIATTQELGRNTIQAIPLLGIAIVLGILTWIVSKLTVLVSEKTFLRRVRSNLLREVARKAIMIPVWIIGFYLILRISGLTRLAMTVVGGTGVLGLVAGFAFRDIAENFLASILISVQNPFRYGDLIEVDGQQGYVQRVNTRGTLLMTMDGNHIQIPNATIYKNTIINYTSNPNRRFEFVVGIGYEVSVSDAQQVAYATLREHPAILNDPEPQVLVEELGSSTVNLRFYSWVNANEHSWRKVRSSVIRLVKREFEVHGYSMPDDAREIVFPNGVPVIMQEDSQPSESDTKLNVASDSSSQETPSPEAVTNSAEGGFESELKELEEQALQARDPDEGGADLLDAGSQSTPHKP